MHISYHKNPYKCKFVCTRQACEKGKRQIIMQKVKNLIETLAATGIILAVVTITGVIADML